MVSGLLKINLKFQHLLSLRNRWIKYLPSGDVCKTLHEAEEAQPNSRAGELWEELVGVITIKQAWSA